MQPTCSSKKITPDESREIITKLWANFREHRFADTTTLFSSNATLNDTLYRKPFKGHEAISKYFTSMENAIPQSLVFVLDDLAPSGENVGARWHVESEGGKTVPFGRGLSMYNLVRSDDGKSVVIGEAWDFPEPFFKVAGLFLAILKLVGTVWGRKKKQPVKH